MQCYKFRGLFLLMAIFAIATIIFFDGAVVKILSVFIIIFSTIGIRAGIKERDDALDRGVRGLPPKEMGDDPEDV